MDKGHILLENKIVEEYKFLSGFTLVEVLIVTVIVGILAGFAVPQFAVTKERALDREAKASLALIRAAEKVYRMEVTAFYPNTLYTSTSDIGLINTNLKLSLPANLPVSARNWAYSIDNSSSAGIGRAARSGRTWELNATGASEDPACTGSCP